MTHSANGLPSGHLPFSDLEQEIRDNQPVSARLRNVTRDGAAVDDEYVVINGIDTTNNGVHLILITGSTGVGNHVNASGAMPIGDFVDATVVW